MMQNVAQTFEERVIAALASIETTLDSLNKTVNSETGGLVGKYIELEKKVLNLEHRLNTQSGIAGKVVISIAWLITTLIAGYNLIQNLKR